MPGQRIRWAALVVAILAIAGTLMLMLGGNEDRPPAAKGPALPTYRVDTDHETFATIGDVQASAQVVIEGTVQSHTVVPGVSSGVDGAGDPLPALPHTDYDVEVIKTIKGPLTAGMTIKVSLTGGATPDGKFVLDGGPILDDGVSALFFLGSSPDGKYYPLAGGAAVAAKQADGSFLLPVEATGGTALPVTSSQLAGGGSRPNTAVVRRDTTAPRTLLAGSRRKQRLGSAIFVSLNCPDEACTAKGRAEMRLPRIGQTKARIYRLAPVVLRLDANTRRKVAFPLPRRLRKRIEEVLKARPRVTVRVILEVSDAAQNATVRRYRVVLVDPAQAR